MIASSNANFKCRISPLDSMILVDYYANGVLPTRPFLIACDAKHLTEYKYDSATNTFEYGPRTNSIDMIESRYNGAIQALPNHLFGIYEHLKSFLYAESIPGSSVLGRTLLEHFVIENYAVDCFHGNTLNLRSTQDQRTFDTVMHKFENVGVSFALEVLSGNVVQNGTRARRSNTLRGRLSPTPRMTTERFAFLNYYDSSHTSQRMIDRTTALQLFQGHFELSQGVHGRHSPNVGRLDQIFESLLEAFSDYLVQHNNSWMVIP